MPAEGDTVREAVRAVGRSTPSDETYPAFQRAFDTFNAELFDGQLPHVLLTLQRKANTCGYLSANRFANTSGAMVHELAMNPEWFAITPLVEILQTLVHEMVHVWQHEFGTPSRGRYHDRQWADKMESIGLMPSDTGQPGGRRTGDKMADYPIEGGRFLKAVKRLVDEKFVIAWYDRFPPARPTVANAAVNGALSAMGLPAEATAIPSDAGVPVVVRGAANGLGQAVANSSNRMKYTCPGCAVNVWGKPGLSLVCGSCNIAFAPV